MSPSLSRRFPPTVLSTLLLLAAGTGVGGQDVPPEGWPVCRPGQVEVMLLGTFHFEQIDTTDRNLDALAPERQAQLAELAGRLAAFDPDRVMVEWPLDSRDVVRRIYDTYREADGASTRRNEAVQVGFRLAHLLDLPEVDPVDYPMLLSSDSLTAWRGRGGRVRHENDFPRLYGPAWRREIARLRGGDWIDYFRVTNDEHHLRANNELMFAGNLAAGEGGNYGGPELLAKWYDRNLRIVHHIHRVMEPGDARLFLVVGSGHVRPLRFLLDEAPQFCPVSPLPYLEG